MIPESPITIRAREIVLLTRDVEGLAAWYVKAIGLRVTARFDDLSYLNLESSGGLRLGIGRLPTGGDVSAGGDARVVPQLETDDLRGLLDRVRKAGGVVEGPARDVKRGFEFGSFKDPDGHAWWVVDPDCP